MCEPTTALGLALSAGGSFLQQREANSNARSAANARNQQFEAERIRQQQFADEAGAAFNQNVQQQGAENFEENRQVEQDEFVQTFNDNRTEGDYSVGLRNSAPRNVVLAREAANNEANSETERDVNNLAALSSYTNAAFNQGLDRNEFARAFGNIQDEASRQSGLLGLRINSASNNAQSAPSAFPGLLGAAGSGLAIAGAAGNSLFDTESLRPSGTFVGPGAPNPGLITQAGSFLQDPFGNLRN